MLRTTPAPKRSSRLIPLMVSIVALLVAALILGGLAMEWFGQAARSQVEEASDLSVTQSTAAGLLVDMETSLRGYIITGDDKFLEPYRSATVRLPAVWDELTRLAAELDVQDTHRQTGLRTLAAQMRQRADTWQREFAEPEIEMRRQGRIQEANNTVASQRGKTLFDDFRAASNQVDSTSNVIVLDRSRDLDRIREIELALLIGLGALALITSIVTIRLAQREARLQARASHAAEVEVKRLEAVLAHLPVAVRLLAPPDGDCIVQNEAASLLFPLDKWNSLNAEDRLTYFGLARPDGRRPSLEESPVIRTLRHGETLLDYEFLMNSPETGPRNLLGSTTPLKDEEGNVTAAVMVVRDITRMKERDQRKDEFIAIAAHELRNPLAALSGYNQLVQRMVAKIDAPPNVARHLGEMDKQIKRINTLVEHLLDTSRIQLGRLVLVKTRLDLVGLVQSVAADARATDSGGHSIQVKASSPEIHGEWDNTRIEQVVINLLSNALRYSPADSEVEIRVEQKDNKAKVAVADRGPGVPESQRTHLFERYYQTATLDPSMIAEDNTSQQMAHTGLGLGLYISSQIVKAHGGEIGVDPNAGGGSIFWFTLPTAGD